MWCLIWCFSKSWKPPDGDHDKVIWNVVETVVGTRRHNKVIPRRDGGVPQRRYWVSHLGVTGDVVETYYWDVIVCFIWDLSETSWRHTDGASSLRPLETLSRQTSEDIRREDVLLRRLGEVPLRRRWVFQLRGTCDVAGTYRKTSLRRCQEVLLPSGILVF